MSDLAERLLNGDKRALARGISLVEDDEPAGWELVREVYPKTGHAAIVGFKFTNYFHRADLWRTGYSARGKTRGQRVKTIRTFTKLRTQT